MDHIGCEPRVDYSSCDDRYKRTCPIFYQITLVIQAVIFVVASISVFRTLRSKSKTMVAPHTKPPWKIRLAKGMRGLAKDTVLQMKLGCSAFSLMAVIHRSSMLQPTPALPHLLVEYSYNLYNIYLIATIATTLRYWQEFMLNAAGLSGIKDTKGSSFIDRAFTLIFSWRGSTTLTLTNAFICLTTDTWGLLSYDVLNWQTAVKIQHVYLSGVCLLISMGSLWAGLNQELTISKVLKSHEDILQSDSAFQRDLRKYKYLFRISYVGNLLCWMSCFLACGVGAIFFDTFYRLAHWILLIGYFNFVGLFFASICAILCWPGMREAELRLHDLLAYCNLARQQAEKSMGKQGSQSPRMGRNYSYKGADTCGHAFADVCEIASQGTRDYETTKHGYGADRKLDMSKSYPCYVMSLEDLSTYTRLPAHEDALHAGHLRVVTKTSYWPCRSYVHFVSQTWIDRCHPDGEEKRGNPKLNWMKTIAPKVLANGEKAQDVFLWMDIFSIPQRTKDFTRRGIASLPNYAALVGGFIPLIQDPDMMDQYKRRGWCMVECICALTPKVNQKGEWRIGPHPLALQFQFYGTRTSNNHMVTLQTLKNPSDPEETDFTEEQDRETVHPIELVCARIMATYARSASNSWDHTYNIDERPGWLKMLGGDQDEI